MTWAQRLKRACNCQIQTCSECGAAVKVIADTPDRCIEDPAVNWKILDHLKDNAETNETAPLPESRAAPMGLFT